MIGVEDGAVALGKVDGNVGLLRILLGHGGTLEEPGSSKFEVSSNPDSNLRLF
jgi:hypothetical protein